MPIKITYMQEQIFQHQQNGINRFFLFASNFVKTSWKGINIYVLRNDIYRIIIEIFPFTQKLLVKGVQKINMKKIIYLESIFSENEISCVFYYTTIYILHTFHKHDSMKIISESTNHLTIDWYWPLFTIFLMYLIVQKTEIKYWNEISWIKTIVYYSWIMY